MTRAILTIPLLFVAIVFLCFGLLGTVCKAFFFAGQDVYHFVAMEADRKIRHSFNVWWAYANGQEIPKPSKCDNPACKTCNWEKSE